MKEQHFDLFAGSFSIIINRFEWNFRVLWVVEMGDIVSLLNKCVESIDGEVRRCFIGELFEDILVVVEFVRLLFLELII